MTRLFFLVALSSLCLLFSSFAFAENQKQISTGNISHSQVVIFQGNQFDLGNETHFKKFIKSLQGYPKLAEKLQTFFKTSLDELDAKNEERHLTLVRMFQGVQTAPQLEERLDKAEADNKALHERIAKLENEIQHDPQFKIVLAKAKEVLANKDWSQYHIVLQEFSDLRKKQVDRFRKEIGETAYLRADEYFIRLDYDNAVKQIAEAVEYVPGNSDYWNRYGLLLHDVAQYDESIQAYNKALAIALKDLGEQHPKVATSYNNLGSAWYSKGDYDKAIAFYNKALAIVLKVLGDQHPKVAIYYNNLGSIWDSKGDYDKAIDFHNKALAIALKVLGDQHPKVAIYYNNLGEAWRKKEDYDKAIDFYNKAL
ncbi:MAG: tetratricopeptide repeat protein, partial [Thermodesulfobacteriota bacterium]|nr:tetratricopeptide repeat protein [Thermodesulfobacteriota bacterium]